MTLKIKIVQFFIDFVKMNNIEYLAISVKIAILALLCLFLLKIGSDFVKSKEASILFQISEIKQELAESKKPKTLDFILENDLKKTKILIIAMPRSGSSLLGKVLSANPDTFYFFEPFHQSYIKDVTRIDQVKMDTEYMKNFVERVYDCQEVIVKILAQYF